MNEKIEFKKQRELGAIITDTFRFIRFNWKSLFGMIFKIAGPALIVLVVAYVFYIQSTIGGFGGSMIDSSASFGITLILSAIVLLLAMVAYYGLLYGTIIHYIKSYIKNDGVANESEVRAGIKDNFWSIIGIAIMVGFITVFGLLLCFIPGIYLGTVLATTYAIHIFEKRDATDSISYSFQLIKGEWWMTFATLLVMFILYYVIVIIVQVPQYVYFFIKGFTVAEQINADPSSMFDWVYTTLSSIGMIVQYLMQTILVISTVFVYFNLNEKKNFTGTMETIETLGNRDETNA